MSPDELDKLWTASMKDAARVIDEVIAAFNPPPSCTVRRALSRIANGFRGLPRPSGWGERSHDNE